MALYVDAGYWAYGYAEVTSDTVNSAGLLQLHRQYKYSYQAEQKLAAIQPEIARALTEQAVEVVGLQASQEQAKAALQRMGIAYREAYQEIFAELVAEMRQAQEDEQVALIVASLL